MRAKEFIVETDMMDLSQQTIHKLADRKGVKWDNEPSFLQLTKRLTGKEHLDDLDHSGLNKVKRHLDGLQGVAEGFSNAVTFFRGEPILSQERLNQLKSSIGKPYPILRKEGSAANIGTYMSPDGDKATSFVKQALAGQGKGGVVTQIQVNPNSFSKGDGGIDEAVIITNIAGLVSNQTPNKNDPLRIQDRKQAMLKYLGPGVKKYLNDPLLSDPKIVQSWYNPEFAQKNWNTINSGKQAVTKPGESNMQERMMRILGPLAENIRRDPEVISYFISHNPGDWVEYNFRMNSDGSGTKVVDVKYYPPAKQGVAEGSDDIEDTRQYRDAIALAKSQKAIRQARYGKDQKFYADGTPVTPEEVARRAAERRAKKQGLAEGEEISEGPFVQRLGRPNKVNIYVRHTKGKPSLLIATDISYSIYDKFIMKAIQKYPQFRQSDFSFKSADKLKEETKLSESADYLDEN